MITTRKADIYISCPVCGSEGYNSQRTYWCHTNCGGKLQLTEEAEIICASCGYADHMSNWSFKCGNGLHDFKPATKAGFALTISTSTQMMNVHGTLWLRNVLEALEKY